MVIKWKGSQVKTGTRATTVERSSKFTLKAINDFLVIEEDSKELTSGSTTGVSEDVINAIKGGTLVLPEIAEGFADKYPYTGRVVSKGSLCKIDEIQVGTHVMFPRLGGMRWEKDGKQYINIQESSIHAIIG